MPRPEKSEFVKIDRGGYLLSLIVSGYHIITISKRFANSKMPISGPWRSGQPEATTSGRTRKLKIAPLECP